MNTIQVFTFGELSPEVQAKVIERNSGINTDFQWWEYLYEDFISIAKLFGYDLEADNIQFSGFWSQGDGASFTCKHINVRDWREAHKSIAKLKEYAPKDAKLHSIFRGNQHCKFGKLTGDESVSIVRNSHRYSHKYTVGAEGYDGGEVAEETILEEARDLMDWLYNTLSAEYDYQTSEESIRETLENQDWHYTASGQMVNAPVITLDPASNAELRQSEED